MDTVRVLLADDNHGMLKILEEYFRSKGDVEVVGSVSDGAQVMAAICQHSPDVLLLDIILPRRDGFSILADMRALAPEARPKVIVLTGLSRDDFVAQAFDLGADYYMVKPFDLGILHERILAVAREDSLETARADSAPEEAQVGDKVANIFLMLGIPAHIKGYQYLREGVKMVMGNHDVINRITKELYPGVARRCQTTPSKVERAMRHAINVAWSRGRVDSVNRLFGCELFSEHDRPTNGEFIALIADKLRESA
ncbi:MAG TPA: sporulation transcription factor Spo0A [Candidatus Ornithocaccomicrobium faecavium]|uniref:Stage 0 sporulation protein A homolog n=1 Tax=Candidatus Ornithocaccomicrobium faecavium TaxID=2840890 RepID=A0A9D1P6Z7_9FIRM|nr:sporulation transcription factor Spo0A [Candidatus Ornithocaccomicrobium faecavium]